MGATMILALTALGYVCGSCSFVRIITRLVAPETDLADADVPLEGTDERHRAAGYGAHTASLVLGPKWGLLIGLMDILKGILPTLAVRLAWPDQPYHLATAVGIIAGHNWPVFYGFEGGRGLSSLLGSLVVIDPLALLLPPSTLVLGLVLTGNTGLSYGLWLLALVPWFWFRTQSVPHLLFASSALLLVMFAYIPDMQMARRLQREGKYKAYMAGMARESAKWRNIERLAKRLYVFKRSTPADRPPGGT